MLVRSRKEDYECYRREDVLVDLIHGRLDSGQRNLDVIQWAMNFDLPMDRVIRILCDLGADSRWDDEPSR